jgi:hypothetical protein
MAGNGLALFMTKLLSSRLTALLAAELAEFDGSGVLANGLILRQFGVTRGHVHDEFRELVDVSGAFAFGHGYSMPCLGERFYLAASKMSRPFRARAFLGGGGGLRDCAFQDAHDLKTDIS